MAVAPDQVEAAVTDATKGTARRLNLEAASFLNGEELPRVVTLNADGQVTANDANAAIRVDLPDTIVFPALVNSHDHLEFNLYPALGGPPYTVVDEWARDVHERHAAMVTRVEEIPVELRRYWGLLKNLSNGVTTVMDHGEPHDNDDHELPIRTIRPFRFVHRADTRWAWLHARYIRGHGPLVFHVAEGTSDKVARRSARFLRSLKSRGPLIGIHGIALDAKFARHLDALVWCPASNFFLFGQTADVAALKGATNILFGTDAGISASGTIWDHLRTARNCGGLSDAELLDSVTTTASRVWRLDKTGDMVIARRRNTDPWNSLYETTAADICAVISGGRLALISESIYRDIAPDAWRESYQAIKIGDARQRVFCPNSKLLASLASIQDAPLTLQ